MLIEQHRCILWVCDDEADLRGLYAGSCGDALQESGVGGDQPVHVVEPRERLVFEHDRLIKRGV